MTDLPDEQTSPSAPPASSIVQEREVPLAGSREEFPVVEVGRPSETEAIKEGLVKELKKELTVLEEPVKYEGEVLVTPVEQQPKIVLPMDRTTYLNPKNWHKPVTEAVRWLLTWAQRIVKMHPGKTVFEKS